MIESPALQLVDNALSLISALSDSAVAENLTEVGIGKVWAETWFKNS